MVLDIRLRAFPYMEFRQRSGKEKSLSDLHEYMAWNSLPYRRLSAYCRGNSLLDKRNENYDERRRTAGYPLN